jgi:hypothetical protein
VECEDIGVYYVWFFRGLAIRFGELRELQTTADTQGTSFDGSSDFESNRHVKTTREIVSSSRLYFVRYNFLPCKVTRFHENLL